MSFLEPSPFILPPAFCQSLPFKEQSLPAGVF